MDFWSHVDRSGGPDACWLWTGAKSSTGYGTLRVGGRTQLAHRVSYELAGGPIGRGLVVLHSCDRRLCVNPAHLSLGTHSQNAIDRSEKHRGNTQSRRPIGRRYW